MKPIDTNILVRYYAQDDALKYSLVLRLFRDEPELFVTKTVLLEFFWVLTQADKFRFQPEQVMAVFEHLQGLLPNIVIEDELSSVLPSYGAVLALNFQMPCIWPRLKLAVRF